MNIGRLLLSIVATFALYERIYFQTGIFRHHGGQPLVGGESGADQYEDRRNALLLFKRIARPRS
jgi:hypothetical protein